MAQHEDEAHDLVTDLHLAASDGNLERCKDHVLGRERVRARVRARERERESVCVRERWIETMGWL